MNLSGRHILKYMHNKVSLKSKKLQISVPLNAFFLLKYTV